MKERYLPENIQISPEGQVAIEAALSAGRAIRRAVGGKIDTKEGMSNVVTEADRESGVGIKRALRKNFETDPILSEETPEAENPKNPLTEERLWIVDELDGSKNFSDRIDNVWVSIAYAEFGDPKVGVAYNPISNKLYFAEKGQGAYYMGRKYGTNKWVKEKIFVSKQDNLSRATVESSMSYKVDQTINHRLITIALYFSGITPRPREIGTSVEQLCRVAAGISDLHFHSGLSPWDYAAAQVIVTEAGGVMKNMKGEDFNFMMPDNVGGNPVLVDKFIQELKKIRGNEGLIVKLSERIRNFNW